MYLTVLAAIATALLVVPAAAAAAALIPRQNEDAPLFTFFIHPWEQPNKCIAAAKPAVGAAVTLEDCWINGDPTNVNNRTAYTVWQATPGCDFSPSLLRLDGYGLCMQPILQPPTGVGSNYIPWSVKNGSGIQLAACDQYGWVDGVCHPKPTTWIRLPLNQFRMMGADMCLDLPAGKLAPGTRLQAWKCHTEYAKDLKNQRWGMDLEYPWK